MSHIVASADVSCAGMRTIVRVMEVSSDCFEVWLDLEGISTKLAEFFSPFNPTKIAMRLKEDHGIIFYTGFKPVM